MSSPAPPSGDAPRDRWLPIASWVLYDFANTMYAAMVLTYAMPKALKAAAGKEVAMGAASAAALVLSALAAPFLGALADATGTFKRQVVLWTILCTTGCLVLSLLPQHGAWPLLVVFVGTFVTYNVALSLYDAFLPDLCSPERTGFVSGMGVGIGYLGAFLGFAVAGLLKDASFRWIFAAAGGMMLLFSLPFFLFVPERPVSERRRFTLRLGAEEFVQAARTIRGLPRKPALFLFLAGNFLAVDSLNAMIQWVGQFFRMAWGAEEALVLKLLFGLSAAAFVAGLVLGWLADRLGARRVMLAAVGSLLVVTVVDAFGPNRALAVGVTMVGGGIGAAGVWLAGRRILIDLAPPEHLGEYMGLLGLTKRASIIGTLLLSVLADTFDWTLAVGSMILPLGLGLVLLLSSGRAARAAGIDSR